MSMELQTSELGRITAEIITLTQQGQRVALSYAIEIGRRLTAAKGLVQHGEWEAYLKENVRYSERTARNFMRLFDEYGAEQTDLFGTIKRQSLADLTYTQALALLAVPDEERDELAVEVKEKGYSNRELEQVIREREEARAALEQAQRENDAERETFREKLESERKSAAEAFKGERDRAEKLKSDVDRLKREVNELASRPVEVAVQNATEEQLAEAREQERKKIEEEVISLKKTLQDELREAEKARKNEADEYVAAKKAHEKEMEAIRAELEEMKAKSADPAEVEALKKQLTLADPATVEFKLHFSAAQEEIAKAQACIGKAAPEVQEKLKAALKALGQKIGGGA